MFILFGEFAANEGHPLTPWLRKQHFGRMWSKGNPSLAWDGELFGLDNGAYSSWRKGKPFPEDQFMRRVDAAMKLSANCIVAVCPDIVTAGAIGDDVAQRTKPRGTGKSCGVNFTTRRNAHDRPPELKERNDGDTPILRP